MYEGYLRDLLAPLGIYDLTERSVSGAAVCALGTGLDDVSDRLEEIEREALTATAEDEGLDRRAPPPSRQRTGGRPLRHCCRSTATA